MFQRRKKTYSNFKEEVKRLKDQDVMNNEKYKGFKEVIHRVLVLRISKISKQICSQGIKLKLPSNGNCKEFVNYFIHIFIVK